MSSAMKLMTVVWESVPTGSWRRLNNAMHMALYLAIDGHLKFEVGDIDKIKERFRPGYWIGDNGWEHAYARAARTGARSAWKEFERFLDRKPFLAHGQRLAVGSLLEWEGMWGHITSFSADGESALLTVNHSQTGRPTRLIWISRTELRAACHHAKLEKRKVRFSQ